MAKQKSGLGRGLNALFDDSPAYSRKPEASEPVREAAPHASNAVPEAVAPAQEKQEPAGVLHQALQQRASKRASGKPADASSDIYISEDALENAKVVSREARKPAARPGSGTLAPAGTVSVRTPAAKPRTAVQRPARQQPAPASKQPSPAPKEKKPFDSKGFTATVKLSLIHPNPDQPRTNFKPGEIEELAGSIKKEGLLQPILVRKIGNQYQILAGERRYRACKSLGLEEVPVRFWEADNDKALELALIENIQRSDLNPIEEAYGYKRLMERKGMTQSEVAQTVSKGRSTIANALRLLDLPEDAQQLLFEEKITAGHARAILSVEDAEGRKKLTEKLKNEKLSVRETEALARLMNGREKAKGADAAKRVAAPPSFKKAAKGLTRFLSAPVRVKTVKGKNKIEIQFKDEDELQRILALIEESAEKDSAQ